MSRIDYLFNRYNKMLELLGVLMRIISFSIVSWMGKDSPFVYVWIVNTIDAMILSGCAITRKDLAYSILNLFWILVGIIGVYRGNL